MCPGVTNFTAFFTPVPSNLSLQIGLGPLFTFAYLTLNTFSSSWPGGHPQHSCPHSVYLSFSTLNFTMVDFPPDPSWIQRGSLIRAGNPLTSSRFWNHWTSTCKRSLLCEIWSSKRARSYHSGVPLHSWRRVHKTQIRDLRDLWEWVIFVLRNFAMTLKIFTGSTTKAPLTPRRMI